MNREMRMEMLWRTGIAIELVMGIMTVFGIALLLFGPFFLLGETSFALWLLIKGVGIERWRALTVVPCA